MATIRARNQENYKLHNTVYEHALNKTEAYSFLRFVEMHIFDLMNYKGLTSRRP